MKQKKQYTSPINPMKSKLNFINAEHVARGLLSKNRAHPLWLQNNQKKEEIQLMELDSNILNHRQHINVVQNDKHKNHDENKIKMKLLSIDDETEQFLYFRYSDKKIDVHIQDQQFLIEPFNYNNEQSTSLSNTAKLNMKFQKLKSQPNENNKTQPLNFLSHSVQKRKGKKVENGINNKKNDMSGLKQVIKNLQNIQNYIRPTLDAFPISKVNLVGNNYQKPRSHSSKLLAPEQDPLYKQNLGTKNKKKQSNSKKIQTQQSQNFCGDPKQWKCYQKKRYKNLNDNVLLIKNQQDELIERLMKNQILKKMRQKQKNNKENADSQKYQGFNLHSDTKYKYVPLSSTIVPFSKISLNHVSGRSSVRNSTSSRHNMNKTPLMSKQKSAQNNKKTYERQKSIMMKQKLKEKVNETQRQKCLNLWKVNGVPAKDRKKLMQLLF